METTLYNSRTWRNLPRETCRVAELVGGECAGSISLHHLYPLSLGGAEWGRTVECCQAHHPYLEALARRVYGRREPRRCHRQHRTREAREACERRLNRIG